MSRDPERDAALLQVVRERAEDHIPCPILRTMELGGGLYALAMLGIELEELGAPQAPRRP